MSSELLILLRDRFAFSINPGDTMTTASKERSSTWLDKSFPNITINWETVTFAVIVLLAIFTRFYDLEARVMSHDESLHTYFSWKLFKGDGFAHTPLMHGPLQFNLIALAYYLFGDSDFSARIPAVLFSIATVIFIWKYRGYLGRSGALITSFLFVISPFMLYYGRYVRNEAYVALFGVVSIWATLRYLDTGKNKYLYYLTAATALHFTAKETSFIYVAQTLVFVGLVFLTQLWQRKWGKPELKWTFVATLALAIGLLGIGLTQALKSDEAIIEAGEIVAPADPEEDLLGVEDEPKISPQALIFLGLGAIILATSLTMMGRGFGWNNLRKMRSFGLMILLFFLVVPHLSAFPVRAMGWDPMDYATIEVMNIFGADRNINIGILRVAAFLVPMLAVSFAVGLWWNSRDWLISNVIFYTIFVVFFTTVFTNGTGFFTGIVGSLGYWLEQQEVRRGSQPDYYYGLIQIPIYEFIGIIGVLLGGGLIIKKLKKYRGLIYGLIEIIIGVWLWRYIQWAELLNENITNNLLADNYTNSFFIINLLILLTGLVTIFYTSFNLDPPDLKPVEDIDPTPEESQSRAMLFILFWTFTSFIAYTVAGEKMPWLTVHIAYPMLMVTGWGLGKLVDRMDWIKFKENHGWATVALLPVFGAALVGMANAWLTLRQPFEGQTLNQLEDTSSFIIALISALAILIGLRSIFKKWERNQISATIILTFFAFLGALTMRASFIATYNKYDEATEYLVYAHSARGVKDVMERVEDISLRTTDGLAVVVAYDDDVSWPFSWYLRNYSNQKFYGGNPTRELREATIIIVGDNNFGKIEPIVAQGYYRFDYIRMWWPMQDYFYLTLEKVQNYISDPNLRLGLYDIWLMRDYDIYGQAIGRDFSLPNWSPSDRMRMYIRKDVASQLWDYGVGLGEEEIIIDPYEGKQLALIPDQILSANPNGGGLFSAPRDIAVAPNGDMYVADSRNNRIVQIRDGEVINVWGEFGVSIDDLEAPDGTFNEPWGVAVSPDGKYVYVADTWNHRIQKFTADGEFLNKWGSFGESQDPYIFYGPRDIVVAPDGNILVTDTGNKRVVVFSPDGTAITQFGEVGFGPGEFDEPVGIEVNQENGWVYVADTWNQRVQVFMLNPETNTYYQINSWEINGWYGLGLENKPFIGIDQEGNIYISDPELSRVLIFNGNGEFLNYFGDVGFGPESIGIASGVAIDSEGSLWVSDGQGNRLLHFTLP